MSLTIGVPLGFAHVSGAAGADNSPDVDVLRAIHRTVYGFAGGTDELARLMGMTRDVLRQKANPENQHHQFKPLELQRLQRCTGTPLVLFSQAADLGFTCQRATPDGSEGNPLQAAAVLQTAMGDFMRALVEPVLRAERQPHNPHPTKHELQRAELYLQELTAAANAAYAVLRWQARPVPVVEG